MIEVFAVLLAIMIISVILRSGCSILQSAVFLFFYALMILCIYKNIQLQRNVDLIKEFLLQQKRILRDNELTHNQILSSQSIILKNQVKLTEEIFGKNKKSNLMLLK